MKPLYYAALIGCLLFTGCAGVEKRRAVIRALDAEPMSQRDWSRVSGVFTGPIRVTTNRFGNEGVMVLDTKVELSGSYEAPDVFVKMQTSFSGAWVSYSEKSQTFTNIPERRYGTSGYVLATTHAPDQLVLRLRRNGVSLGVRPRLVITFRGRGCADVDYLGGTGWRGEGSLRRVPYFGNPCDDFQNERLK